MKRILLTLAALSVSFSLFAASDPFGGTPSFQDIDTSEYLAEADAVMDMVDAEAEANLQAIPVRFLINLVTCWILVGLLYYRKSRRRDYYFTLMAFSVTMVLLLAIMGSVEVGIGLTLGLFAIFGVIRYRTETVPIREMTYLFIIISVSAMNGIAPLTAFKDGAYVILRSNFFAICLVNVLILAVAAILESGLLVHHTTTKLVLYDRIDLIVPDKRAELIADLEKRLGVSVKDVEIGHVDFLKDAAFIKVFYDLEKGTANTVNMITRAKDYVD